LRATVGCPSVPTEVTRCVGCDTAALHDGMETVMFLKDKGANMRAKSIDGYTCFQIAVKYGFPEMMDALYDTGGGACLGA
jgi:hypothetical protein